jgi:hypothetical protein
MQEEGGVRSEQLGKAYVRISTAGDAFGCRGNWSWLDDWHERIEVDHLKELALEQGLLQCYAQ